MTGAELGGGSESLLFSVTVIRMHSLKPKPKQLRRDSFEKHKIFFEKPETTDSSHDDNSVVEFYVTGFLRIRKRPCTIFHRLRIRKSIFLWTMSQQKSKTIGFDTITEDILGEKLILDFWFPHS